MAPLKRARADSAISTQQVSDGQDEEEEGEPWGGFSHPTVEENLQLDSADTDANDNTSAAASDDLNTAMDEDDDQITTVPPRRSTRDSTRGRRPGKDVGLRWREANAEKAAEKAERSRKKAVSQGKKNVKAQQVAREEEGIHKIASLEAQRAHADRTDAEYVKAANASGYHQTSPSHSDSGPSGSEYGADQDELNVEDEAYEFNNSPPTPDATGKLPKTKPTEAEKRKQRQGVVLGRIEAAADELDNEDDAPVSHHAKAAAKANAKAADTTTAAKAPPKAKPGARSGITLVSSAGKLAAFNPTYRTKLLAGSSAHTPSTSQQRLSTPTISHPLLSLKLRTSTASLASPAPTPSHSPSPSPTSTPSRRSAPGLPSLAVARPQSASQSNSNPVHDSALGGFDDQDIRADREVMVARPKGRYPEMTEITEIEEDANVKIKKAKIPRTPKANMAVDKSLSAEVALPEWLNTVLNSRIMPTLIDHYGSEKDPWTVDSESDDNSGIRALLQQLIDEFCPRREYKVAKGSPVLSIARQRIINWRRGFMTRANTVVLAAYKDIKERNPRAPMPAVAAWAHEALDLRKGEALWEHAAVGEETKGTGKLLSVYMLRTFAPHLQQIAHSELDDHRPPVGAISLACSAVEIAFECYRTGQYQYPTVPFNKKEAGDRSDGFYKDTVKGFIMKPEEYDVFLEKVRPFVDRLTPGKSAQHASKRRRRTMGSSPPPESD